LHPPGARAGSRAHRKGVSYSALSLGIVASLTPPDIDVRLIDENLHDIDFSDHPDLVA